MDLEYLYQDAVFVIETGEYHPTTKVYQAARKVLIACNEMHCPRCGKFKMLKEFPPSAVNGKKRWCTACNSETHGKWQKENYHKLKDYKRNYYFTNKKDFESELNDRPHTLYRLYNNDTLLYVGISVRVKTRLKEHQTTKIWWQDVTRYELSHYPSRDAVLAAEYVAIKTEFPVYNKTHAES